MTLLDTAKRWFGAVKSAPVERKVAELLTRTAIDDKFPDRVDGTAFEPGLSYFGIRLSGLHLVDARRFATAQLPLCVCLVEFQSAGQRRTVPFSIGPDVVQQKLKAAGITGDEQEARPAWIELVDLTVVRPTPVSEDNVSLYTGLFSVPGDDLVKTLLNVVGSVGSALGQPQIGPGLKVAETIYDSFGSLLGSTKVQQVAAALIGNVLTGDGSGYLLVANIDPQKFDIARARVVRGRLCWPEDVNQGQPVVEFDHALLALEQFGTIVQKGTGMAPSLFGTLWTAVGGATSRDEARAALRRLQDNIAASPDLTENDRIALIGGYAKAAETLAQARWGSEAPAVAAAGGAMGMAPQMRGAAEENLSGRLRIAARQYGPEVPSTPDQPLVVKSVKEIATLFDALGDRDAKPGTTITDESLEAIALDAAIAIGKGLAEKEKLDAPDAVGIRNVLIGATRL